MSTLPHPISRSLFKYRDAAGALVPLRGTQPYSRQIDDYVMDSSKFAARFNTVNKVLKADVKSKNSCVVCDETERKCAGQACIVSGFSSTYLDFNAFLLYV